MLEVRQLFDHTSAEGSAVDSLAQDRGLSLKVFWNWHQRKRHVMEQYVMEHIL
ncbi:hypothetical protein BJB45_08690 [Halomonas huangheensis]|uniref:Uncharacterized protein n=1 Tax=Halomonas huangheensis TaxID=1178482 RepID=W1N959_9GAMM|nr:hypothetical protein BJB45_08690 [Halomonas huangheensis]